jgi:hypothetical protein
MVNDRLRRGPCRGAGCLNLLLTALLATDIVGGKSFRLGRLCPDPAAAASEQPVLPPPTWFLVCSWSRQA